MLNITNLDSNVTVDLDFRDLDRIISNLGILSTKANTPIYLVNPETMDTLYPPEKTMLLDEECVKKQLEDLLENYFLYEDDFFDKFDNFSFKSHKKRNKNQDEKEKDDISECQRKMTPDLNVAVGLYKRDYKDSPAVFITPERCKTWGKDLKVPFMMIFEMVLYHELAHAYLDNRIKRRNIVYYDTWWGKFLEESFANAMALRRFNGFYGREKASAVKIVNSQPMEYRGALVLMNNEHKYMYPEYYANWRTFSGVHHRVSRHIRDLKRRLDFTFPFLDPILPQPVHWKMMKNHHSLEKFWKLLTLRIMMELL